MHDDTLINKDFDACLIDKNFQMNLLLADIEWRRAFQILSTRVRISCISPIDVGVTALYRNSDICMTAFIGGFPESKSYIVELRP